MIILNENIEAERLLETHTLKKTPLIILRTIARYYMDQGYNSDFTKAKLEEYIMCAGENPRLNIWSDLTDNALKQAKKRNAVIIDGIKIYSDEIEQIKSLQSVLAQRLAFTLLCIAKYRDLVSPLNNHWVTLKDSEIMRLANINQSIRTQGTLYRKLQDSGMVKFSKKVNSVSMQVCFCSQRTDNDYDMIISDFRNLGNQLMWHFGGRYYKCKECGLVLKLKQNHRGRLPKYCPECAVKIHTQQKINSMMKTRKA